MSGRRQFRPTTIRHHVPGTRAGSSLRFGGGVPTHPYPENLNTPVEEIETIRENQERPTLDMARAAKTKNGKSAHLTGNGSVHQVGTANGHALESDLDIRPLGPSDFDSDELLRIYRTMLLSRRLDEKMLTLLKQGKGFSTSGVRVMRRFRALPVSTSRRDTTGSASITAI